MKKTVEFGRYFSKNNELREIEWIILDEAPDGKKLLISKNCIEAMQYEYRENKNKDPKWENCVIRLWLNNYFINSFFTVREKEKMYPVSHVLADLTPQEDKVVMLSAEEVEKYMPDEYESLYSYIKNSSLSNRPSIVHSYNEHRILPHKIQKTKQA